MSLGARKRKVGRRAANAGSENESYPNETKAIFRGEVQVVRKEEVSMTRLLICVFNVALLITSWASLISRSMKALRCSVEASAESLVGTRESIHTRSLKLSRNRTPLWRLVNTPQLWEQILVECYCKFNGVVAGNWICGRAMSAPFSIGFV